ncbi:hypothetical protein EUGRSUZ_L00340 [Eucalyptus grandis]|uniref:Uncharacterized protein n=2 Tax=Eucalyptus grandis TaxID=71139 RepID=A0ACC3L5S9_EUCGR|nr:hypothetical protein EUGRSUZ_L00340 [Eucalyptus grandis]
MPPRVEQGTTMAISRCDPERDDELPRRNCPPVHYVVKINSVTELLKLDTYESGVFEAGGYEWSLCLHPKGYRDHEGKVYMSLYLSIEEPNKLGDHGKVVVDYKFFVFDNIRETYVTFKEKGKELRAFSKAKTQWGLSKFLSLGSFNNTEYGFRKGDYCKFGAEVMVSKSERKKETLTIVKDPPHNKTTCKIREFSTSKKDPQYSDAFTLGRRNWKLKVFPQRNGAQEGKSLSVYLQAQGLPPRIKMYVKAKLRVLNKNNPRNNQEKTVSGWLSAKNYNCGRSDFMPWGDLEKPNGGFVNKKELAFAVEILVISDVARCNESV